MSSINITMLQIVAKGLEELKDQVVFVGGSVAELYANNPAASEIRTTIDVDCVIELSSKSEHAKLEDNLRAKGFTNDISRDAPICRWVYQDIKVDVMPTNSDILGFSNQWYPEGIENKIAKILPNGTKIFIFTPAYYLAAKFEAHNSRGGKDLRQSHDFEDIIYVLDNCSETLENIRTTNKSVKNFLKGECTKLLHMDNITEGIGCMVPYGSQEENVEVILELIKDISLVE